MNVTVLTVTFFKTSTAWTDLCLFSSFLEKKKKYIQKKLRKPEAMHSKNYLKIRGKAINFIIPLSEEEGFSCLATGVCAVLLKCSFHFASYSLCGGDCYFYFRCGIFNFLIYVFILIVRDVL